MATSLRIWTIFEPMEEKLLRQPAAPVNIPDVATPAFQTLIDQMVVTMKRADGVGLAAPQIGQSIRLAVVSGDVTVDGKTLVFINPNITSRQPAQEDGEEGCLSIPGVYGFVNRSMSVTVSAFNREGKPFTTTESGLAARVIQHEVDHVNGILFIDHAARITKGQSLL